MLKKFLYCCSPLLTLLVLSSRAEAGQSYVENSYRLRSITSGVSHTDVFSHELYSGYREAFSHATKAESGQTTVTEDGDGRTFSESEGFEVTSTAASWGQGMFLKTSSIEAHEAYDFSGFEKLHRVTSGFSF